MNEPDPLREDDDAIVTRSSTAVAALVVLGLGVAVGAFAFGAPPRFDPVESAGPVVRLALLSLLPELAVHLAIAAGVGLVVACGRTGIRAGRGAMALVLLLLFGAATMVPLPAGLHETLSPFTAETYAALAADWPDRARPLSLWPDGTWRTLLLLLGMLGTYLAVRTAVRERGSGVVRGILAGIVAIAVLQSGYGLYETLLGDDTILGFGKVSSKGAVTGTFIHRTMFAVWAGMGCTAALALSVGAWRAGHRVGSVLLVLAAVLTGCASFLSLSRLGFAAVLAGAFVTLACLAIVARRSGRAGPSLAVFAVAVLVPTVGLMAAVMNPAFAERMGYFVGLVQERPGPVEPRIATWTAAWRLAEQAPVLGTGPGSFARAVHLTQTVDSPEEAWFAHSDPLNVITDMGWVGFALVFWWVFAALRPVRASLGTDTRPALLSCGAVGGATVVLVASLADFQTQFPVVALPFAALMAVPGAVVDASRYHDDEDERGLPVRTLSLAAGLVVMVGIAIQPLRGWMDRWAELESGGPHGTTVAERELRRGRALLEEIATADDPRSRLARARIALETATLEDPLLDQAHFQLAVVQLVSGEGQEAALRSLGRARHVSRGHAALNLRIADTYLRLIGTQPNPYGPPGDDAPAAMREAGALEPALFSAAWRLADEYGFSADTRLRMVPERAHALMTLARWLENDALHERSGRDGRMGREERVAAARDALRRAVEAEPWNGRARVAYGRALAAAGREDDAFAQFKRAVEVEGSSEGVRRDAARGMRSVDAEPAARALFEELELPWPRVE